MIHPYPVPRPPRPAVVTVAFWLQCALVGALVLLAGTGIAHGIWYDDQITQAAAATSPGASIVSDERGYNLSDTLTTCIPLLVMAVWLGLTVAWVRRGSNVARILTWVGIGSPLALSVVSCFVGGLFGTMLFFAMDDSGFYTDDGGYYDGDDGSAFYGRLESGRGSVVFDVLGATFGSIAVLCGVAVVVLLAVGAANRFFRPRGWVPLGYGVPGAGWYGGGVPGYPGVVAPYPAYWGSAGWPGPAGWAAPAAWPYGPGAAPVAWPAPGTAPAAWSGPAPAAWPYASAPAVGPVVPAVGAPGVPLATDPMAWAGPADASFPAAPAAMPGTGVVPEASDVPSAAADEPTPAPPSPDTPRADSSSPATE